MGRRAAMGTSEVGLTAEIQTDALPTTPHRHPQIFPPLFHRLSIQIFAVFSQQLPLTLPEDCTLGFYPALDVGPYDYGRRENSAAMLGGEVAASHQEVLVRRSGSNRDRIRPDRGGHCPRDHCCRQRPGHQPQHPVHHYQQLAEVTAGACAFSGRCRGFNQQTPRDVILSRWGVFPQPYPPLVNSAR